MSSIYQNLRPALPTRDRVRIDRFDLYRRRRRLARARQTVEAAAWLAGAAVVFILAIAGAGGLGLDLP